MRVIVNGESKDVAPDTTVAELLRTLGLAERLCATEINRKLVPKRSHAEHILREGDAVEIVTLVGGG